MDGDSCVPVALSGLVNVQTRARGRATWGDAVTMCWVHLALRGCLKWCRFGFFIAK